MLKKILAGILICLLVLLTGCGEHPVEKPTAPTEIPALPVTEATQAPTVPEETVPETTVPEVTVSVTEETLPVEETVPMETAPAIDIHHPKLTQPRPQDMVCISDYIPDAVIDLRYATENNISGSVIYNFQEAFLRYGTVEKLQKAAEELAQQGLYLKIWDGFRPASAQEILWEAFPDSRYVANPKTGFSAHSRGNAVDVTLVDDQGQELEMPTDFDVFTSMADRDYTDCTETARANALLLETVLEKHGLTGYWGEWWHFTDDIRYEVEDVFDPADFSVWTPNCKEFITLREKASTGSDAVTRIPVGERFLVLGFDGKFAMADYAGLRGYVLQQYILRAD